MQRFLIAILLIAAAVASMLQGGYLDQLPTLTAVAQKDFWLSVTNWRDPLICVLALLLLAEAAFSSRKPVDTSKENSELDKIKAELETACEKGRVLQTALNEAHKKIEEQQSLASKTVRSELIDAELVNLLAVMQERGRLVDFLMDDITSYDDAQVGAVARTIHQGCATALKENFEISTIESGEEGAAVTLQQSSPEYRLVGKFSDNPPYKGTLLHHGWQTSKITLPRVVSSGKDAPQNLIIAPAEVELS